MIIKTIKPSTYYLQPEEGDDQNKEYDTKESGGTIYKTNKKGDLEVFAVFYVEDNCPLETKKNLLDKFDGDVDLLKEEYACLNPFGLIPLSKEEKEKIMKEWQKLHKEWSKKR
jgi:hypothetical protein